MTGRLPRGLAPVAPDDCGIYVHFPYCAHKCPYCDFNSHTIPHQDAVYADAIIAQLQAEAPRFGPRFRTLYFGGGTPSLWAPRQVGRVVECARQLGLVSEAEVTLEANPGSVDAPRLQAYLEAGINRFSIGAQSFSDAELASLGRIHDAPTGLAAVKAAIASGAEVSLDLIYAQPGQTHRDVADALEQAITLGPRHISAYTLTVEPDTLLGRRTRLGLFKPMQTDAQAALVEQVKTTLQAAGYRRYEVSNFAKPGSEAVHNSIYWLGGAYLGVGAGANGHIPTPDGGAERWENVRPPREYLAGSERGVFARSFSETLAPEAVVGERLWLGLRTAWGIDLAELEARTKISDLTRRLEPTITNLEARGWIAREGSRARPTEAGFLFGDAIGREVLGALAASPA